MAMAVGGTPLCGDPALPRPLALAQRVPLSHVETLAAMVPRDRRAAVALDGMDAASIALLKGFMADLGSSAEEPHAAAVVTPDGGAHFLCPPCPGAARLLSDALPPGAPQPRLTAAALAVSLLLTDGAAAAAAATRQQIMAACAAAAAGGQQ
jgi:hypothetical protein